MEKFYAIQDFMQDKWNMNGTNDLLENGYSRDELGFNESEAMTTIEENETMKYIQDNLGFDAQTAYNMTRGINGATKYTLENGILINTNQERERKLYDDLAGGAYFNDPRNQGSHFKYMNYFIPSALEGQRSWDAQSIDYYYTTILFGIIYLVKYNHR